MKQKKVKRNIDLNHCLTIGEITMPQISIFYSSYHLEITKNNAGLIAVRIHSFTHFHFEQDGIPYMNHNVKRYSLETPIGKMNS